MSGTRKPRRVPITRLSGRRFGTYDLAKVDLYRAALRRRQKVPPIFVAKLGKKLEIFDGYHRVRAHKLEKRKTIMIFVVVR
jgi:ParB-like chromosome segregation protein Spo0J